MKPGYTIETYFQTLDPSDVVAVFNFETLGEINLFRYPNKIMVPNTHGLVGFWKVKHMKHDTAQEN